ncbi:MAG: hypothetical protein OEM89_05040 [Nitrosopumilus sp.]|nr:hypothetical protein [Nitrosopumilus sp.]
MSALRDIVPIRNPLIDESKFRVNRHNQPIIITKIRDGDDLSNDIFYSCIICEGPLVPVSNCTFCKKATLRKCTRCDSLKNMHSHESCKSLVSFGRLVFQKNHKEVKV